MTSLTGSTAATLSGTVAPPTVQAALLGSVVQIATLSAVWLQCTSVASCIPDPRGCWHDPWARQVLITLTICLSLWLLSLRTIRSKGTSDPSIVDRLWSILPWLYCWHWYGSAPTPRGLLLATLASIWGLRLTANFARKGGFSGGEDYRWAEIRTWPGFDRGWEVFNLLFICGFQQLVLLAFSSPAAAAASSDVPLNALDAAATALYLLLLAGEATADRQMMRFQTEKYRRLRAKEPLGAEFGRGFLCSGLWRYSRHPNYFCEVAIWWAFYLFSLAAGLPLVNWTISGAAFLTCLFVLPHASLDVTEVLSSRKYPQYAEYQATVSRFFPLPPLPAGERAPMRLVDAALIGWFCVGLAVTFLFDIEAVLVQRPDLYGLDAAHTPLWPPEPCVRAVRWWSAAADPLMHARGGVCMPHVLLAAAIAQSQPQQSFPAALAPRPPVRPILGHDLQRLAARMSLDETIVPWAAEQEVEEWEPAAGYDESTFPSLGLLERGECDCDADAPRRHVRSSGDNVFYLCDCAGGGGVSTRGLDRMGPPNPAPPTARIRHLEYCASEAASPRTLDSFVLLPGQLCAELCAAAKSALRSMTLDALYVRKRGGNGPLLPKSETDHERPDRIHFGCCAEAEEGPSLLRANALQVFFTTMARRLFLGRS